MNCQPIDCCRICGSKNLQTVVALGEQAFTGIFPRSRDEVIPSGPLTLVKCNEQVGGCGLVQLGHSFPSEVMYGQNYGYRSGLNQSMVKHLQGRARNLIARAQPNLGDLVLDIGSNDATTLRSYPAGLDLVGIDPTGVKFARFYPDNVRLVPDFFSAALFEREFPGRKARIVSSFSMFYDLPDPTGFMADIRTILADDGIWAFEQSYLPAMIQQLAYDTICHEHLSYYALKQIKWMTDRVGLKIIDLELNDVNGGSFCVTVARQESAYPEAIGPVTDMLAAEERMGLTTMPLFLRYREQIFQHRDALVSTLRREQALGRTIYGYGASTKGNVLLQFCGLGPQDLPAIAEVNEDKFGAFTPGTLIPIKSEAEVKACRPDGLLVMPWHFRDNIVAREAAYLAQGGQLLFPLPRIESVDLRKRSQVA